MRIQNVPLACDPTRLALGAPYKIGWVSISRENIRVGGIVIGSNGSVNTKPECPEPV